MKSYIITATLKTSEEVDRLFEVMRKGTLVVIKEVEGNDSITTEYITTV